MRQTHLVLALALLPVVLPPPAFAQASDEAVAQEMSAERLEAAKSLIAVLMPPAQREQLVRDMGVAILDNMIGGMMQDPKLQDLFRTDPRVEPVFERFVNRTRASALASMTKDLPELVVAMENAYARRFNVEQMSELVQFFETPTGQFYLTEAAGIMSDPDVAAWQRESMQTSMAASRDEVRRFMTELAEVVDEDSGE